MTMHGRTLPEKSADAYAAKIAATWQKAVASILETSRLLIEAKDELPHGKFGEMIKKLPFGERTAEMLMTIAKHSVISNPKHVSHLPPSWGTLHRLTALPDEALEDMLASGIIHADIQRKEVDAIIEKLDAVYLWVNLRKSLIMLIAFMNKWPKSEELMRHVWSEDSDNTDGEDVIPISELSKLEPWIASLVAACEQQEATSVAASQAADEAFERQRERDKALEAEAPKTKKRKRKYKPDMVGDTLRD
jgi:hypothetical protein